MLAIYRMKPVVNVNKWWWIVPIMLVSFWSAVRGLNADMIWEDERYSLVDAGVPTYGMLDPVGIWERLAERNPNHTPAFYVALNLWGRLVGWEPPALRGLSALFGLLTLAWTYRLSRDLLGARLGVYAAAVLASSSFFSHYTHELRMYTLHTLLSAFVIWLYLRLVRRRYRAGAWSWIGLTVGAALMLYTDYIAALPLIAVTAYHALFAPKVRGWRRVPAALAAALLLFAPWLRVMLAGIDRVSDNDWLAANAMNAPQTVERLLFLFGNGLPGTLIVLLGLALIPLFRRETQRDARQAWFFVGVTFAALLAANAALPILLPNRGRYLLMLFPALAVLAALGFSEIERAFRKTPLRLFAPATLAVWMFVGVTDSTTTADLFSAQYVYPMHSVAASMQRYGQPLDGLINFLPTGGLGYRHNVFAQYYFDALPIQWRVVESLPGEDEQQRADHAVTLQFAANRDRLWVASMPADQPAAVGWLREALDGQLTQCPALTALRLELDQYVRDPACCIDETQTTLIAFGDRGMLRLTALSPLPQQVSETLRVTPGWWLDAGVPADTYSVGLHVLDANGNLVAQSDYGLQPQTFDCRAQTINVRELAAGTYQLHVLVYNWQTGVRLIGMAADGSRGERLEIGMFEKS